MNNNTLQIENLIGTIRTLRDENGCPWDRKQNPKTMLKYLQEEVGELIQAVEAEDTDNICEEIGDVLYILIMLAEMHREHKIFSLAESIDGINRKLIRRHPHVFEGVLVESEEQLRQQWQKIKKNEKR